MRVSAADPARRGPRACHTPVDLTRAPRSLSIPTIKALPAERKGRIVALFQKHYDTEVID
jgi:hypothetical protein